MEIITGLQPAQIAGFLEGDGCLLVGVSRTNPGKIYFPTKVDLRTDLTKLTAYVKLAYFMNVDETNCPMGDNSSRTQQDYDSRVVPMVQRYFERYNSRLKKNI